MKQAAVMRQLLRSSCAHHFRLPYFARQQNRTFFESLADCRYLQSRRPTGCERPDELWSQLGVVIHKIYAAAGENQSARRNAAFFMTFQEQNLKTPGSVS